MNSNLFFWPIGIESIMEMGGSSLREKRETAEANLRKRRRGLEALLEVCQTDVDSYKKKDVNLHAFCFSIE